MEKPTHIVIIPSPWFSVVASVIEFSKHLIQHSNDLHVTCLIPTLGSPSDATKTILQTLPSRLHYTFLPPMHYDQQTPKAAQVTPVLFGLTVTRSLPHIHDALQSLNSSSRVVALVTDLFTSEALTFAKEFNMLSFIYLPTSAMALSFYLNLPKLDQIEFKDLPEPIDIPGCVPIHIRDIPKSIQDRSSEMYLFFLQQSKKLQVVDGILVNSFGDIEAGPIRALSEEGSGYPTVYPVGPIIQSGSSFVTTKGSEILRWLDNQVPNSVLYVSFGSGGSLSQDQINELALGLEISGQKFLWVARAPSELPNAAHLNCENDDPLRFIPYGFIERTKEQGLVVPSWAPQVQVLSHDAVGGFLTHCGWNSTLESVMNGVPLIAWPLFAEQGLNAVMLSDGLKVAMRPKANENGLVEREEVAKVVRGLIEGEEGREIGRRMEKLKNAAAATLQEEGSSTKTLTQFAVHLMGK